MGQHTPNYSDRDEAIAARDARNAKATSRLFDLLCLYHPAHCPEVAHKRNLEIALAAQKEEKATELAEAEEAAAESKSEAPLREEDDRIAEWVARQLQLKPKERPWNDYAGGLSIRAIQHKVCQYFGIERADLTSLRRTNNVVIPRQIAMYLARKLTPRTFPEIGRYFGGRDHTTVLHAFNKIQKRFDHETEFRQQLKAIATDLGGEL